MHNFFSKGKNGMGLPDPGIARTRPSSSIPESRSLVYVGTRLTEKGSMRYSRPEDSSMYAIILRQARQKEQTERCKQVVAWPSRSHATTSCPACSRTSWIAAMDCDELSRSTSIVLCGHFSVHLESRHCAVYPLWAEMCAFF